MKDSEHLRAGEPSGAQARSGIRQTQRILVVDDESVIRKFSTEVLISSGYGVDAAADGADAWQALNTQKYDLLITDNRMPKVSGVELFKKLRAARMALPVIMATGTWPEEEFTRYPWLQPAATLMKPYTTEELLGTVQEVLRATDAVREPIELAPIELAPTPNEDWTL